MQTSISPNASIAKSAIIKGPGIIEDNVTIDDFCKIIGPTYIGNGSFIGTGSLVRECMIGSNTKIGYNCEIGRTYLAGDDEIAHVNIILDSIIGKTVWFGGFSRTANMFLTNRDKNIIWEIGDGKSIDIGTHRFGSIVGNNCTIGTSVTLLPARHVPANTVIPDETTYGKNIVIK
jgi:NDP-sugar pyrophosphorylase family protein